jgi:NADH:ubiquinone oxidoreductase subunit F (NADH-binding)
MSVAERPLVLSAAGPVSLSAHRAVFRAPAALRGRGPALLAEIEASGLRGRGGASFPTAQKLGAVAGRDGVVVVNATEGEPASAKDRMLLETQPHLVIDGAVLAAHAVDARTVHIGIARSAPATLEAVTAALVERGSPEPGIELVVHATPEHFVVGEETALVHWINGGDALPTGRRVRMIERGVGGRPTAVINCESAAQLAWIINHGAHEFRRRGTDDEPGSRLATITRGDGSRWVVEADIGMPLAELAWVGGAPIDGTQPVLVGGYFGAWISGSEALEVAYSDAALRPLGASIGAGVLVPLPEGVCAWCETARLLEWMAGESSRQCGVCVNGLPALASAAAEISRGENIVTRTGQLERWARQIDHRGGCGMPDGAVGLLRSALRVHRDLIAAHAAAHGCPEGARVFLTIPETRSNPWR